MSRKYLVPLALPADPVNALEATTKQYVDNKATAVRFHRFVTGLVNMTGATQIVNFSAQDLVAASVYKVTTVLRAARTNGAVQQILFNWQVMPAATNITGMEWFWQPGTTIYGGMTHTCVNTGTAMNLGKMRLVGTPSGGTIESYWDASSTVTIELISPSGTIATGTPV